MDEKPHWITGATAQAVSKAGFEFLNRYAVEHRGFPCPSDSVVASGVTASGNDGLLWIEVFADTHKAYLRLNGKRLTVDCGGERTVILDVRKDLGPARFAAEIVGDLEAEILAYIKGLQPGERVIETGQSGMKGRMGTVYVSRNEGVTHGSICVLWDEKPGEGGQMGTSVTWGTRRMLAGHKDQTAGGGNP
jgi:hypothetical protein